MALLTTASIQGLTAPEAYARIGALNFNGGIGPTETLRIDFRVDTYATREVFLEGELGALRSDSVSIEFPAAVPAELEAKADELCSAYSQEELRILAFALSRRIGYGAVKAAAEFEGAIDA